MSDDIGQLESDLRSRIERGMNRGVTEGDVPGLLRRLAREYEQSDRPDAVPDNAMPTETDNDCQNYVNFPVPDLVEWYTVYSDDETVQCEQFVARNPVDTEALTDYIIGGGAE